MGNRPGQPNVIFPFSHVGPGLRSQVLVLVWPCCWFCLVIVLKIWDLMGLIQWHRTMYDTVAHVFDVSIIKNVSCKNNKSGCYKPGTHFNIKMPSHWYRNSHDKDRTVSRPSYLYNGNSYTRKDGFILQRGRGYLTRYKMVANHAMAMCDQVSWSSVQSSRPFWIMMLCDQWFENIDKHKQLKKLASHFGIVHLSGAWWHGTHIGIYITKITLHL